MEEREWVLSVDVGTSSVKAAIFDGQALLVHEASVSYPLLRQRPGLAELDPHIVLEAFYQAIRDVLAGTSRHPNVLVLSTAMHALMAVDEHDQPLTRLVTWADQRAEFGAASLRSSVKGLELYNKTGTPIHAMSPLVKLAWFRDNAPDVFSKANMWADLKSWILWNLLGEWVIDTSLASATGLYNLFTRDWDAAALDWCGVTRQQLPRLVNTTEVFRCMRSKLACSLGLASNTEVVAGASDGALATLGVGAVSPGSLAISIGTSGAVRGMVKEPKLDSEGRLFCYVLDDSHYIVGGPINNGGILLRWLQGLLSGADSADLVSESKLTQDFYAQLNREVARVAPGSNGLFCLPYLTGERAPIWREDVSGSLWGLQLSHTRGHLMRAVLEGISYQLNSVVQLLTCLTGAVQEVRATGGFTDSTVWIEILTDVLGIPLGVPEHTHGTALGGAFLAWHALGQIASWEEASTLVPTARVQAPDPFRTARYRQGHILFKELITLGEQKFRKLHEFAQGGVLCD